MNQIAIREPGGRSVLLDMSDRYGMEPAAFEATLRATVVPKECSREQFAAFLLVAKEYKLNPLLKEIYAFPAKGGGIQPIVGVDGWANLINSHPSFDGMDFEDHLSDAGDLVSITCRMHRKDRSHPVTATEYLAECKRPTDPWRTWPRRMLRHKAMIQAARYAFSFAGIVDPDEAERYAGDMAQDVTPRGSIVPISQRIARTEAQREAAGTDSPPPPAPMASAQEPESSGSEGVQDRCESTPSPVSNSVETPPGSQPDTPAGVASSPQPPAGNNSEDSSAGRASDECGGDDAASTAGDTSSPPLPEGWAIGFAGALRRAQKPESLKKFAVQFWAQYGGFAAHRHGPNGPTAEAIFAAFERHFGDKDAIEAELRELI